MSSLKTTNVLQKLYKNSIREGQVSLVSTHDVTNPYLHIYASYIQSHARKLGNFVESIKSQSYNLANNQL